MIWPKLKIRGYIKRDNSCGITLLNAVQFISESISVNPKFQIPNLISFRGENLRFMESQIIKSSNIVIDEEYILR